MDALPIFIFAAMEGVCDTPLQFLAEDFSYGDILAWHTYCASRRTIGNFIFAAVEGVCDTPLQFLAEDFLFADYMNYLSSTASVEAESLINVFICLFAYSKLPVRFAIVKISF